MYKYRIRLSKTKERYVIERLRYPKFLRYAQWMFAWTPMRYPSTYKVDEVFFSRRVGSTERVAFQDWDTVKYFLKEYVEYKHGKCEIIKNQLEVKIDEEY